MWPFLVRLGPITFGASEIFVLLGFAAAAWVGWRRFEPKPTRLHYFDFVLGGMIGGFAGARLFTLIPTWIQGLEAPPLGDATGSAFYGGMIGGAIGVSIAFRIHRQSIPSGLDIGATALPIAFAVGKIGCFLTGCCYGAACEGFPGVEFPPDSLAFRTQVEMGLNAPIAVHPAQLYEAAFGVALFFGLDAFRKKSVRPGETAVAWVTIYAAWRFLIEFLRDDPGRHYFGVQSLSDSQLTAVILFVPALAFWIWMRTRGPERTLQPD